MVGSYEKILKHDWGTEFLIYEEGLKDVNVESCAGGEWLKEAVRSPSSRETQNTLI